MWVQIPHGKGQFWEKGVPIVKYRDFLSCCAKSGLTDRLVVLVVDLGGLKEAQVQSYSPGGANVPSWDVPSWEGTLAQPHKYDCPAHVVQWSYHLGAMCSRA